MLKMTVLKLQSLMWALMLALALLFGAPTLAAADAAPTVVSVIVPSDGTYGTGQNLDFTVQFNAPVVVDTTGGTPSLSITVGSTVRQADYISGSGTLDLVFRYVVSAGEQDADGVTVGALSTNNGALRSAGGADALLALNRVGATGGVRVDGGALPQPQPVPTLSEWAMILLGVGLAGGAALSIRRRPATA